MDDRSKTVQSPNPQPPPPPSRSPDEFIDFSEGDNNTPSHAITGISTQLAVWTILGAAFLALAFTAIITLFIARQLPAGGARIAWITYFVLAFGTSLFLVTPRVLAWYRRQMTSRGLKLSGDPTRRVRCACSAAFRDRLGSIPADPFEPVIVRVLLAAKPTSAFIWAWVLGGIGAAIATVLFLRLGLGGWRVFGASLFSAGYLYFTVGASGGAFIAAFLFPTYLRIAPGRADVLRFGFLGRGRPSFETFDLRASEVVVITHSFIALVRGGPTEPWRPLVYAGSLDRTRVVRALLAAAVSEHPTPPMPDDALLG